MMYSCIHMVIGVGVYSYDINQHFNFNKLYIQLVFASGIDGVYNKQVMHVYHVITHIHKGSINHRQPYFQNKVDLKHS